MTRIRKHSSLVLPAIVIVPSLALLHWTPWWVLPIIVALIAASFVLTKAGRQVLAIVLLSISTLPQRLGSSAVIVVGIAGVVGVLVAILAMGAGFERTLQQTGSDNTVIVLSAGARSEVDSTLTVESVALISQLPQISRSRDDQPLISPDQLITATLAKKSTGLDARVAIRGIDQHAWRLWPTVKITAGRAFTPGLRELVVGKGSYAQFAGLAVGSTVQLDRQPWTIVGIFETPDAHNSEIWGDAKVLGSAYRRQETVTSLAVGLAHAGTFDSFKAMIQSDRRLRVDVQTTREYYRRQSATFTRMMSVLGATIGVIMAVGAIASAINATYSAIEKRTREIATLRAMGFRTVPVILSVLLETMILAALGGLTGAVVAWALFDGFMAATMGASGQLVFALDVSTELVRDGLTSALIIGFIGGVFPAIRAARMPIATGLRET